MRQVGDTRVTCSMKQSKERARGLIRLATSIARTPATAPGSAWRPDLCPLRDALRASPRLARLCGAVPGQRGVACAFY